MQRGVPVRIESNVESLNKNYIWIIETGYFPTDILKSRPFWFEVSSLIILQCHLSLWCAKSYELLTYISQHMDN